MIDFLKKLGFFAVGLMLIAIIAWIVFPSTERAVTTALNQDVTPKKTISEIIVRDFLGIPKCGLLGGGCDERTSEIGGNQLTNPDIRVVQPQSGSMVTNQMLLEGAARVSWFVQGIAPGEVKNERGEKIGAFTIRANTTGQQSNAFVTFSGTLQYGDPGTKTGYVVFRRAGTETTNPSLSIPVRFQETLSSSPTFLTPPIQAECRRTGCSGQVCADQEIITTCEFRPEFACYQNARCERQSNGACGFTITSEVSACLAGTGTAQ